MVKYRICQNIASNSFDVNHHQKINHNVICDWDTQPDTYHNYKYFDRYWKQND